MVLDTLFERLYTFWAARRMVLLVGTGFLVSACLIVFSMTTLTENIHGMLPDDNSEAAVASGLLQEAPFSRKVIIQLSAGPQTSTRELLSATDALAKALEPTFFSNAVIGPGQDMGHRFINWLLSVQPSLTTDEDLSTIEQKIRPESVRTILESTRQQLLSFEGAPMKDFIRSDPLSLRSLCLEKLRFLNLIPGVRLAGTHFVSADRKNSLIIADTPIAVTDSLGGRKMIDHFQKQSALYVPRDIETTLVSGHRYALENSDAIKKDLYIVFVASSVGLLLILLFFIRSWLGIFVYLMPVLALCIAGALLSCVYPTVSAITIGFGAVLLGISVDYSIHVFYALRSGKAAPERLLAEVSRPVTFGVFTTVAAFALMLLSALPGQRELAVFSIMGIGSALLLSLIVFPHLVSPRKDLSSPVSTLPSNRHPRGSKFLIGAWLVLLAACAWQAKSLRLDGDLRSLYLVSDSIRRDEARLQETWGSLRGKAMIFLDSPDLQSALERNEQFFESLAQELPMDNVVSLAPIFPAVRTQQTNQRRWASFWSGERRSQLRTLLEGQGLALGFTSTVFQPFFDRLDAPPRSVSWEDARAFGLGQVLDSLLIVSKKGVRLMTLVQDTAEAATAFARYQSHVTGALFVSQNRLASVIAQAIGKEFTQFLFLACLAICLLLTVFFQDIRKVALALIPVVTGVAFMMGVMGAWGIPFNLYNIVAAVMVVGLAVDYGIFMVCKVFGGLSSSTERAVLVSGLTTFAGFGSLILARHPALHSMGLTVALGMGAAIPSALFVIPAFCLQGKGNWTGALRSECREQLHMTAQAHDKRDP